MNRLWVVAALTLASADASACPKCECVGYFTVLRHHDEPRDVALNARVITGTVPDPARKERFVLRPTGGQPVAVTSERLHVNSYETMVLTPTAPLAPKTEYELVMLRGDNVLPYSTFVTSDGTDAAAPTWTGELQAKFVAADACSVECNDRRGARVEITAPAPADDRSGADLAAVWITSGAAIDYSKPPSGYVHAAPEDDSNSIQLGPPVPPHVTIVLGGPGPCTEESIALPRGAKQVRVGMKVIDRAGNASEPREIQVRLAMKH